MCFVPVDFSDAHCTIAKPDVGHTFHLAPVTSTKLRAQFREVTNAGANSDRLDVAHAPYDFEVHVRVSLPGLGTCAFAAAQAKRESQLTYKKRVRAARAGSR